MIEGRADPLERLAAFAGVAFALVVLVFLAALAADSLSLLMVSFALGLLVTVLFATAACWSAWRLLSWPSLILIACPLVAFPLSLRLTVDASGAEWLASFIGLSALFAAGVGLAASRSLRIVPKAIALSIFTALLLGVGWVLAVLLLWRGDVN